MSFFFFLCSCVKEYLELREGSTEKSEFIGRYCSNTPNYITTEGNALFVKYFTDTDDPKDGFRGTISMCKYFLQYSNYQAEIGSVSKCYLLYLWMFIFQFIICTNFRMWFRKKERHYLLSVCINKNNYIIYLSWMGDT